MADKYREPVDSEIFVLLLQTICASNGKGHRTSKGVAVAEYMQHLRRGTQTSGKECQFSHGACLLAGG